MKHGSSENTVSTSDSSLNFVHCITYHKWLVGLKKLGKGYHLNFSEWMNWNNWGGKSKVSAGEGKKLNWAVHDDDDNDQF